MMAAVRKLLGEHINVNCLVTRGQEICVHADCLLVRKGRAEMKELAAQAFRERPRRSRWAGIESTEDA